MLSQTPLVNVVTVFLTIAALFIAESSKGQLADPQLALGAGTGIVTAYAGAAFPKTNNSFYFDVSYYPLKWGNQGFIDFQGQSGTFVGNAVAHPTGDNFKAFINDYLAVTATGQLYLGAFYSSGNGVFLDVLRSFYAGIGVGITAGNISNINLSNPTLESHTSNVLLTFPLTGGYELTLMKTEFEEPVLKLNFSSAFSVVPFRGLDGYYEPFGHPVDFYNYYAIGIKYVIVLRNFRIRTYNKLQ